MLVSAPAEPADVAFLLKMLPSLEQQEKGSSARLLGALRAPFVVVSFPTESLGGREKGMRVHYASFADNIAQEYGCLAATIEHPSETFYVLERRV